MNLKERIVQYLIDNQGYIKHILSPHTKARDEFHKNSPVFYDEINYDYNRLGNFIIINEVTKALAVSYVDVMDVIEDINIGEYLEV